MPVRLLLMQKNSAKTHKQTILLWTHIAEMKNIRIQHFNESRQLHGKSLQRTVEDGNDGVTGSWSDCIISCSSSQI